MLQAQVTEPKAPLEMVSVPILEPPKGGLLVKTAFAGICGSDLHFIKDAKDNGDGNIFYYSKFLASKGKSYRGVVLGHEISGTIVKFGDGATPDKYKLHEGDRVAVFPWLGCRECEMCCRGYNNFCRDGQAGTRSIGYGYAYGGYSEYVIVPDCKYVVKIPSEIPLDVACMLPCSGITAYSAINKAIPIVEEVMKYRGYVRLVVYGAGGVGSWAIALSKVVLAGHNITVVAADIKQEKLESTKQLGADDTVLLGKDDDVATATAKMTAGGRPDVILDFIGSRVSTQIAVASLNEAGALVIVGLAGGQLIEPLSTMIRKQAAIRCSYVGSLRNLQDLVELVKTTKIVTPHLEHIRLQDVNETLDRLRNGEIKGRALIKYQ